MPENHGRRHGGGLSTPLSPEGVPKIDADPATFRLLPSPRPVPSWPSATLFPYFLELATSLKECYAPCGFVKNSNYDCI